MFVDALAFFIHIAAVTIWVGGMFFAYVCLRPASAALPPEQRLPLWQGALERFLRWVGVTVVLILLSGGLMMMRMGASHAPWQVQAMAGLGILMMLIFGHVRFATYRRLQRYVDAKNWPEAGKALDGIRRGVGMNLILGFIIIALAGTLRG